MPFLVHVIFIGELYRQKTVYFNPVQGVQLGALARSELFTWKTAEYDLEIHPLYLISTQRNQHKRLLQIRYSITKLDISKLAPLLF